MQVEETKSDGLALELKVTVPAEDIQAKIDDRLARLGRNARVPGFRPGKIPLKVLRGRYAKQVLGEVLEELVSNSSQEVLREREIKPALQPQISIDSYDEGQALEYSMAIDLMPETGDVDLKGISVTRPVAEVSDGDIDKVLENIASRNKQFKPVEKPRAAREGDQAVIDFVGRVDGEEFEGGKAEDAPLELGSGMFIPGFEEQLLGAKPGDRVEVKVTFPEEYGSAALAGKDAIFDVTVKEIKEPAETSIDDDFAKNLGFDELKPLREAVREQILADCQQAARQRMKQQIMDQLHEGRDFELPPRMLEMEFDALWKEREQHKGHGHQHEEEEGKSEEEVRAEYQDAAARRVRLGLMLSKIGEDAGVKVSEEETNAALMREAQRYQGNEQQVMEFYRSNPQAMANLNAPLYENKVVDYILEMASVTDEKTTVDAVLNPEPEEQKPAAEKKTRAAAKPKSKTATKSKTTTAKKKTATSAKTKTAARKKAAPKKSR